MRSWKKRLWSLLLCGAMLASLCPTALAEDGGISYLDENGEVQSCETYTTVTADGLDWNTTNNPSGWYVVENSVEIEYRVTVTGEVHLILVNGVELNAKSGIEVSEGNSLTIYAQSKDESAMGRLEAYGDVEAAIGGGVVEGSGGNITINGGRVTADGGYGGGAGIGGGKSGDGGNITINGGRVAAVSGFGGTGIGGGYGGSGGTITISGGTVKATSKDDGAGIGGGDSGAGGTITISGGTVTAASGLDGAGIGGGEGGSGGSITISGGTVEVSSANGADIGGGYDGSTGSIVPSDKIEISGGTVTGPDGNPPDIGPATHEAKKDEWDSNDSEHWYPCTVADCPKNHQFNKTLHSFDEWIVDQAATPTQPGSRHRDCSICHYRQTETIPPIEPPDPVDPPSGGGYTPPTYKPDVTQPDEGGTVSVTPSRPERGDTVTIKPRPDEGYELDSITVTDRKGESVELTAKPNGTYTFRQPNGKVKIEVTYKRMETPWSNPFADVFEGDWYYEAVRFVQEQGLMNGYSDGRFAPEDTLSRAQLAQILFSKEGRPGVDYLLDFSDVAGGTWYAEAVRWAASQGIVGGYGDGTFGPNDPITREQLAVMLWRYSGSPAASKELYFNDEREISGFALEALCWAVENGILNGGGAGRLGPQEQATRAQAAQMLKSFIENQEENT